MNATTTIARATGAARGVRHLPVALAAALLTACAVGPQHVRPNLELPARFAGDTATAAPGEHGVAQAVDAVGAEFWRSFADPQLDALIEQALQANHDLRIALAHYDRANALLRGARFDFLPTLTVSGEAAEARASADQMPGAARAGREGERYNAGIGASWELDLFGRVRRGVEAGRADAASSAADLAATQVVVVGEVMRTYMELRGLQERLRVARANVDNQRETLRIVASRLEAGRGTEFDTSRARAQLETTLARIPALQAQASMAMHRIAVLTGRTPDALIAELEAHQPLPALPARIDPGAPGELLRRRPDIAAAEQRLHAATARIGVATADLFPRFTLSGLIGSQAIDTDALFERDSETRLIALGVDWSFLDIGRVRARIAAADADAQAELARYQRTVLLALEDAENALVRHARARVEDRHLTQAAADGARAAQLARTRYDAGAGDLFEVLDAERVQLQAQDALADARTRGVVSAVAVYRALAGGWPQRLPQREEIAGR